MAGAVSGNTCGVSVCTERKTLRKSRAAFLIAALQGTVEIRTKKPNVEQLRLWQLIVLYCKAWRGGVFTSMVKFPQRGGRVL